MKVLILASDFQTGGITASMINFVCELTRRGHKVDILNMSGETVPVDLLEVSEIIELHGIAKYWNLNFERIREASGVFRKIMLLLFGLIKKLLNRSDMWHKLIFKKQPIIDGYDLAIAYRQFAPCYYFALNKTAAKTKIAFVHCFLDDDDDIGSWELYLRYFDKIACVSDAVKDALIKRQPQIKESAFTVYNMFDPIKINMLSGVYKSLFDPKCFNIVTVTRLGREKCVDRIPEICIMLESRNKLLLVCNRFRSA